MSDDEKDIPVSEIGLATVIDLGEDLLDQPTAPILQTAVPEHTAVSEVKTPAQVLAQLLRDANVLFAENFLADAKKNLHQILLQDPKNLPARRLLEDLRERELQALLRDQSTPSLSAMFSRNGAKGVPGPHGTSESLESVLTPEEILYQLDQDLGLGLLEGHPEHIPLAGDKIAELEGVYEQLLDQLRDAGIQDWVDLGIGFLEMGCVHFAIQLLRTADQRFNEPMNEGLDKPSLQLQAQRASVTSLLARAFLLARQPLEALSQLQKRADEPSDSLEADIELFYWMGRTYEAMGKREIASSFYTRVLERDPQYRDLSERLRKD